MPLQMPLASVQTNGRSGRRQEPLHVYVCMYVYILDWGGGGHYQFKFIRHDPINRGHIYLYTLSAYARATRVVARNGLRLSDREVHALPRPGCRSGNGHGDVRGARVNEREDLLCRFETGGCMSVCEGFRWLAVDDTVGPEKGSEGGKVTGGLIVYSVFLSRPHLAAREVQRAGKATVRTLHPGQRRRHGLRVHGEVEEAAGGDGGARQHRCTTHDGSWLWPVLSWW
jgi:hypothetical protein